MGMKKYKQINEKVELCIPPELEPELKKVFKNEMEYGFRQVLEDGRLHYVFTLTEEKAKFLQKISNGPGFYDERSNN